MSLQVLHVVDSLVPQADSVGVALPGLLRVLGDSDCAGTVAVLDGRTDVDTAFDNENWNVHPWDRNATAGLIDNADVVHIHGLSERGSAAFARAAQKRRTPFILAPLGAFSAAVRSRRSLKQRLVGGFGDRALLRSAAAVQALHTVEAQELSHHPSTGLVVQLPYSADLANDTTPATIDADAEGPCLLMLGPIDPVEGVVAVLMSLAEIGKAANGWRFVLAGPTHGEWRAMLEAGIRRKGSEDRVVFSSAPDLAAQHAWLKQASLLVAGGLRIRPAVSIMQAVAMGVPVLSTNYVVPDELIEHVSVCGPTRAALRMGLREALEMDDQTRLAKAAGARDCFNARLDWSVLAPRYAELYRQVTAAK